MGAFNHLDGPSVGERIRVGGVSPWLCSQTQLEGESVISA